MSIVPLGDLAVGNPLLASIVTSSQPSDGPLDKTERAQVQRLLVLYQGKFDEITAQLAGSRCPVNPRWLSKECAQCQEEGPNPKPEHRAGLRLRKGICRAKIEALKARLQED